MGLQGAAAVVWNRIPESPAHALPPKPAGRKVAGPAQTSVGSVSAGEAAARRSCCTQASLAEDHYPHCHSYHPMILFYVELSGIGTARNGCTTLIYAGQPGPRCSAQTVNPNLPRGYLC